MTNEFILRSLVKAIDAFMNEVVFELCDDDQKVSLLYIPVAKWHAFTTARAMARVALSKEDLSEL